MEDINQSQSSKNNDSTEARGELQDFRTRAGIDYNLNHKTCDEKCPLKSRRITNSLASISSTCIRNKSKNNPAQLNNAKPLLELSKHQLYSKNWHPKVKIERGSTQSEHIKKVGVPKYTRAQHTSSLLFNT